MPRAKRIPLAIVNNVKSILRAAPPKNEVLQAKALEMLAPDILKAKEKGYTMNEILAMLESGGLNAHKSKVERVLSDSPKPPKSSKKTKNKEDDTSADSAGTPVVITDNGVQVNNGVTNTPMSVPPDNEQETGTGPEDADGSIGPVATENVTQTAPSVSDTPRKGAADTLAPEAGAENSAEKSEFGRAEIADKDEPMKEGTHPEDSSSSTLAPPLRDVQVGNNTPSTPTEIPPTANQENAIGTIVSDCAAETGTYEKHPQGGMSEMEHPTTDNGGSLAGDLSEKTSASGQGDESTDLINGENCDGHNQTPSPIGHNDRENGHHPHKKNKNKHRR